MNDKQIKKIGLLGIISIVAMGLIVVKFWPSDLVTKPDALLKAVVSNDPKKIFSLMSEEEREVLGVNQTKFSAIYETSFRKSFDGVALTGHKASEINGNPPFSGYVARQVKLSGGSTALLTANGYITEKGAQINVLRSLIYLAAACEVHKVKPVPTKADKGQARLDLLKRLSQSGETVGVMGLYDEESRNVIPWAEMEIKLTEHLAHFKKS